MREQKKEQTENNSECPMLKQSLIFIFKFIKDQGCNSVEDFINFWEKQ